MEKKTIKRILQKYKLREKSGEPVFVVVDLNRRDGRVRDIRLLAFGSKKDADKVCVGEFISKYAGHVVDDKSFVPDSALLPMGG